jgi:hypothetical protein
MCKILSYKQKIIKCSPGGKNQKKCPVGFAFGSHAGQNIHAIKNSQYKKIITKVKNPKC